MINNLIQEYAFVLDAEDKPLAPTAVKKAWYLIRHHRATLASKYPMVIRLNRIIPTEDICKGEVRCGIDDGAEHTGIALVQKCKTRNKTLFKGTIEHRGDVSKKMTIRKGYRRNRRAQKRYRPQRVSNRASSKRAGRIPPSVLQKKQAVVRVVNQLRKWININAYYLEDVAINTQALTLGYMPYRWQYQQPHRLDENIRKAVILRDGCQCRECGKRNCKLEVHHIIPRRFGGTNVLSNLISLCEACHRATQGKELMFATKYQAMLGSAYSFSLKYAEHSMQGKAWLRNELQTFGPLILTTGGDTANKRIDWCIAKSHVNDAICIADLKPDTSDIKDWIIKPMRRRSKAKTDKVLNIRHHDLVEYTYQNGETHRGYVTALYPHLLALNFQSPTKHCKKVNARKCKLLWSFNKVYWFDAIAS